MACHGIVSSFTDSVAPVAQQDRPRDAILIELHRRGPLRLSELARTLGYSPSQVRYHLSVLEKEGWIRSCMDGGKRMIELAMSNEAFEWRIKHSDVVDNDMCLLTLQLVTEMAGIPQAELCRTIGVAPSTVRYYLDDLEARGLVWSRRTRRYKHIFPSEDAAPALEFVVR